MHRDDPNRPPDPSPALIHMPLPYFGSARGATKFNQPLSFDTSEVTNMNGMFYGGSGHVRYARALASATPREAVSHMHPLAFISFLYSGRARPLTSR